MEIFEKIILTGILGAALCLILKKESPVFSLFISVATAIIIFFYISDMMNYAVLTVKALFLKTQLDSDMLISVFKICAIGILAEYFCSIIEDAGETGISKKIELSAKIFIFTQTLPLVIRVIESIWGNL